MHDAGDRVDALLINRDARVLRFTEQPRQVIERSARVERQHVNARRHQFAREAVAEFYDRMDHLPFAGLEDPLVLADVNEGLHFFFGHLFRFGLLLLLLIESRENPAQWKEHRPEQVVKKM